MKHDRKEYLIRPSDYRHMEIDYLNDDSNYNRLATNSDEAVSVLEGMLYEAQSIYSEDVLGYSENYSKTWDYRAEVNYLLHQSSEYEFETLCNNIKKLEPENAYGDLWASGETPKRIFELGRERLESKFMLGKIAVFAVNPDFDPWSTEGTNEIPNIVLDYAEQALYEELDKLES